MVVRMVDIKNIEFLILDVIFYTENVLEIFRLLRALVELQGMIQMKLVGGFNLFS